MSVQTFTLLVDDPQPVFDWLDAEVETGLVRQRADQTVRGWTFRVAFDEPDAARRFEERWRDKFHP